MAATYDIVAMGKVFQSMPIIARVTPQEARSGLKLLNVKTFFSRSPFYFDAASELNCSRIG